VFVLFVVMTCIFGKVNTVVYIRCLKGVIGVLEFTGDSTGATISL
jgi:hypothetical protein